MNQVLEETPNVAPSSTKGHYINNARKVFCISEVKEAFLVEGDSIMTSENHGETPVKDGTLTMPQQVLNPFTGLMERSRD